MEIRDKVLLEAVAILNAEDKRKNGHEDASLVLARIFDDVYKTMTPMQIALLKRWHSYICPSCGYTMEAHTTDPEDYP